MEISFRIELDAIVAEFLIAVEHSKGIGNAVISKGNRADRLRQAHSLIERALMDVAACGVSASAANMDLIV